MRKTILILSFLLVGLLPSMAQVDTVVVNTYSKAVGKVEQLPASWSKMKMHRLGDPKDMLVAQPMKDLTYIRFADGFRMDFVNGVPVRDNLLNCPTMKTVNSKILAEGFVRLNKDELKTFLGDRVYSLGYRPDYIMYKVGGWQLGIGSVFFFMGGFGALRPSLLEEEYHSDTGYDAPATLEFLYYVGGMAVSGLVSMKIGYQSTKEAVAKRADMNIMSRQAARKEFWLGLAGIGAGVGVMALGRMDWQRHYKAGDERFPIESVILIAGGALLSNISTSHAIRGLIHMSAQSRYNARLTVAPNGLVLNF